MTPIAKGTVASGGAASAIGGGYVIKNLIYSQQEPEASTLKQENVNTYDSKFGGAGSNKEKLVANDEKNKDWWNWVFENKLKPLKDDNGADAPTSTFKAVTEGYGSDTSKSLNKVCESVYGKNKTEVASLKKDAIRFCAKVGTVDLEDPAS